MDKIVKTNAFSISLTTSWILHQLGGWDLLLQTLITFMLLDFLSGLMNSYWQKNLSSSLCFIGITKKIMIFVMICVAVSLERILGNQLPLRELVLFFYLTQEGLSILENSSSFIPLPEKLRAVFEHLQQNNEKR